MQRTDSSAGAKPQIGAITPSVNLTRSPRQKAETGSSSEDPRAGQDSPATGWALGAITYLLWAVFPLYFVWLEPAGSLEVIVHRCVWGLVICALILTARREIGELRALWRNRRAMWRLMLAGVLIIVNWTTYVYAVMNGHVVDAALGYFTNPLLTVALGVVFLRERLSALQVVAVTLGAVAVLYMMFTLGYVPWISLALAFSFGLYSLVKKSVASQVKPLAGMVVETATTAPFLLAYYIYLVATGATSFQKLAADPAAGTGFPWWGHLALLIGAGAITVVPLLLFARAARSLPLYALGLLQYISPVGQFAIGVWVFHEAMAPERWITTGIIVLALVVLSVDTLLTLHRPPRRDEPETATTDSA